VDRDGQTGSERLNQKQKKKKKRKKKNNNQKHTNPKKPKTKPQTNHPKKKREPTKNPQRQLLLFNPLKKTAYKITKRSEGGRGGKKTDGGPGVLGGRRGKTISFLEAGVLSRSNVVLSQERERVLSKDRKITGAATGSSMLRENEMVLRQRDQTLGEEK